MVKVTQDMLDRFKAETSPEAQALREGGFPELKHQVELATEALVDVELPIPALKKKHGSLTRKRPTKLSMAVGFGLAYQRADSRVKR